MAKKKVNVETYEEHDPRVHTWIDFDLLKNAKDPKKLKYVDHTLDDEGYQGNQYKTIHRMGLMRAEAKEKNLDKLRQAIDVDGIKTIKEAMSLFPDIRTKSTIYSYLKHVGRKLLDEENGRMYGSDEPMEYSPRHKTYVQRRAEIVYVYYDKDPAKGGKEISKEEYLKIVEKRNQLIEELKQGKG